jgi:hypothetical protein
MALSTFLNSLLSELMAQHSSYTIVIKCDRATMPARSLRKRIRPSTRPSSPAATPCYGRSVSSTAINIRSHSKSLDGVINKTLQTPKVPVSYEDSSDIIVPSPSPSPTNKMGVRQMSASCSELCVNHLPTMSPGSARWRPSKDIADSGLTCPKRRESI